MVDYDFYALRSWHHRRQLDRHVSGLYDAAAARYRRREALTAVAKAVGVVALVVAAGLGLAWLGYATLADPVASRAVVTSYDHDGRPLYWVRQDDGTWKRVGR